MKVILIVGAFLAWALLGLLLLPAGAATHTITCAYIEPCPACPDVRAANNDELPCVPPHACTFDDQSSWAQFASHGILCPPTTEPCMYQFADSSVQPAKPRSVFWPLCQMDGRPIHPSLTKPTEPTRNSWWWCKWFNVWCESP